MNPDIEKLLDQLLNDRREYGVVDWKASLRAHLESAWYCGYTAGANATYTSVVKLAARGSDVSAIVTGIERVIAWSTKSASDNQETNQ